MNIKIKPCVGCGFCCLQAKCQAAIRLYGPSGTCKSLIWNDNEKRYFCDLMLLPGKIGEKYKEELYAGEGCCSSLNSWRNDIKNRTPIEVKHHFKSLDKVFQMFLKSFSKQFISGDSIVLTVLDFENEMRKDGLSEEEIINIKKSVIYHISNSRSNKYDSFLGKVNFAHEKKNRD